MRLQGPIKTPPACRMQCAISVLIAILLGTGHSFQASSPVEILEEPHHVLSFQNAQVRVFHLKLKPNEVTLPHHHRTFYAFLSLKPATISNEVRGRAPVLTQLEANQLHTSKGGFVLAERNNSTEPVDVIVIEVLNTSNEPFRTPMGGFGYHDAAFGELFETAAVRGYSMILASGGHTEQHQEMYDRLLIAESALELRDDVMGESPSTVRMNPGEVRWIPRGATHAMENLGASPATFITFEFH
jgi:hypothetical protein